MCVWEISMISLNLLERKMKKFSTAKAMVLWGEMAVFMRSLEVIVY